jgi:hypothetical protein
MIINDDPLGATTMQYYCSSPHCRNECGKKEKEDENRERMWRDPQSVESVLIYYEKYCDDHGRILRSDYTQNQTLNFKMS